MELANYSVEIILFLFFIGIIVGFIDTLVGGGGLLSIPAIMISGVPPIASLGTNKLQASFGIGISTILLLKYKKFTLNEVKFLAFYTFVGSLFGALFIQFIDGKILSFVIPLVLIVMIVYFVVYPEIKIKKKNFHKNKIYEKIFLPIIGCYDGMFGPGTGSFYILFNRSSQKFSMLKSAIVAKPLNFSSNIASLIIFVYFGQLVWLVAFIMILGQIIGVTIGTKYLVKANPTLLRFLIIILSSIMLMRYIYTNIALL